MKIQNINSNISFQRRLNSVEKIENRIQNNDAKKAIGLNNLVLITHTQSFPSLQSEDTGIGVMSLNRGTKAYIDFAYDNGFDGISIEPYGIVKGDFYSPYDSTSFSKKTIIDIKALTQDKWANILDKNTFNNIVKNKDYNVSVPIIENGKETGRKNVKFDSDRVIYDYALNAHEYALKTAWENFKNKIAEKDPIALELNKDFKNFKIENDYYLKGNSIYNLLSEKYNNDDYTQWPSDLHKNLFNSEYKKYTQNEKTKEINRLEKENKDKIEFYKFCQFVVDKQQKEFKEYTQNLGLIKYNNDIKTIQKAYSSKEIDKSKFEYLKTGLQKLKEQNKGINIIGDKQIGYSNMDIWANPSLFTKDEYMGAPPNLIKGSLGQDWNFKFIPQEKLFKEDGSLNEGGIYLKQMFKKAFEENSGGLRIDHILGMIDPWTYKEGDENNKITPTKFNVLLLTSLKDLNKLGINQESVWGLKNPLEAILNDNSEERKILVSRGIKDFKGAKQVLSQNSASIEEMKHLNVCGGKRYMFNYLLEKDLKELKGLGFNEKTISGVFDPIRGIEDEDSIDRKQLYANGIRNFAEAKDIIERNEDKIIKRYAKTINDIVLEAGKEVLREKAVNNGQKPDEEEIENKIQSLLICEDLGSLTMPLRKVMELLNLKGMRNAFFANPYDKNHVYREGNPIEQGNYFLIGTHDNKPVEIMLNDLSEKEKEAHTKYISKEMGLNKNDVFPYENKKSNFIRAKVARIFAADNNPQTPNNVILNWLDLFGKKQSYNIPGKLDKEKNWNLRISNSNEDFEKIYYEKTLPARKGLNIPEILSRCIESAGIQDKYKKLNSALKITASKMEE